MVGDEAIITKIKKKKMTTLFVCRLKIAAERNISLLTKEKIAISIVKFIFCLFYLVASTNCKFTLNWKLIVLGRIWVVTTYLFFYVEVATISWP